MKNLYDSLVLSQNNPKLFENTALIAQLTAEIQPLVPEMQVVVVVDHNYGE